LKPEQVYLLNGSATKKMVLTLLRLGFFEKKKPQVFEDLSEILVFIKATINPRKDTAVVFSPGAASFEKFKNEFDRGAKFSKYAKEIFG
jgi:UDP-N-acetylmuramoylalanine-D-glutamate ligase